MRTRAGALGMAICLLAAACGDSTADDASVADAGGTDTTTSIPAASTSDAPSTTVALPASFRGVTSDTINLGAVWSDLDELREMGLVDINYGDIPLIWDTLVDDLNARGGIGGRQVQLTLEQYNPVLAATVEDMCIRLTEDTQVFAVIGSLAGPALEAVPCLVESQETIVVGGTHRPELLARARAPWITTEWSQLRRYAALLELYDREGLLGDAMAVLDDHREHEGLTVDIVLPTLDRLGYDPLEVLTTTADGGDELALESQVALFSEKLSTTDVDTLLIVQSSIALGLPLIREAGFEGTILTVDSGSFLSGIGGFDERDPAIYAGAYGPTLFDSDDVWAMPSTLDCVATFEAANPGIDVIPSNEVPDGEPQWASALIPACRFLQLFAMIAEAAGPDLTNDSFADAAYTLGTFELPGQPFNSITPDKLDANDGMGLGIFDPDVGTTGGLAEFIPYTSVTGD